MCELRKFIRISSAWFLESWGARLNRGLVARSSSKLKNPPACMLVNAVERYDDKMSESDHRKCAASTSELPVDKSDDSVVVSVVEGVSENQELVPVDQGAPETLPSSDQARISTLAARPTRRARRSPPPPPPPPPRGSN
ncbi:pentatricopeptide repeat-containing protein At5g04810, chloroplastic isoform X2 [Selaginella moellendorffii]|uniref:pentatricopeptide repeat-containing protein At5g04810, chloroplastic isoform X2 n=1 Tax=Selaginella moellendorffii TaxID=88036 RepID=UPI000D1C45CD|nr:pentatricopeptide repeat-containing protein At5g04810, chloroplastic isoform X2 [Selaginella moellendorffii]|eukprot:XP_024537967.1 pentatricopeptide repeat-containing protein At5g04810, chloroplastic isoform X2 [Selaginella moellendorffii]